MSSRKSKIAFAVAVALVGLGLIRPWNEERSPSDRDAPREVIVEFAQRDSVADSGRAQRPVQLRVHAPSDVQVGERFEAQIDLDVSAPLRQLLFVVTYEKSHLTLVGWSIGTFTQQASVATDVGAQEPSDGSIQLSVNAGSGATVAGTGNLGVLRFEAIRAGASGIKVKDVLIDGGATTELDVTVLKEGAVTIH